MKQIWQNMNCLGDADIGTHYTVSLLLQMFENSHNKKFFKKEKKKKPKSHQVKSSLFFCAAPSPMDTHTPFKQRNI